MGTGFSGTRESNSGVHIDGGDGLSDLWIIGEPFFRDVQVAFHVSLVPLLERRLLLIFL